MFHWCAFYRFVYVFIFHIYSLLTFLWPSSFHVSDRLGGRRNWEILFASSRLQHFFPLKSIAFIKISPLSNTNTKSKIYEISILQTCSIYQVVLLFKSDQFRSNEESYYHYCNWKPNNSNSATTCSGHYFCYHFWKRFWFQVFFGLEKDFMALWGWKRALKALSGWKKISRSYWGRWRGGWECLPLCWVFAAFHYFPLYAPLIDFIFKSILMRRRKAF